MFSSSFFVLIIRLLPTVATRANRNRELAVAGMFPVHFCNLLNGSTLRYCCPHSGIAEGPAPDTQLANGHWAQAGLTSKHLPFLLPPSVPYWQLSPLSDGI